MQPVLDQLAIVAGQSHMVGDNRMLYSVVALVGIQTVSMAPTRGRIHGLRFVFGALT
jgi:hypothetical protein